MTETFYLTTPIYYVNDIPHIGHAYTTIASDVLARYKRFKGYNLFFLTGTDEHGRKVEKAAQVTGETPIELADRVVKRFDNLWKKLNISNDDFIRTTDQRHVEAVSKFFRAVQAKGDIYLGEYEDWYCVPCESFWTDKQLMDGKCPDCTRVVEKIKEKSYFFRMSKYQELLLKHLEQNPDFIKPSSRQNEIVSFVKEGLRDLSISRTSFNWGIPVPESDNHIFYVWFDALLNYLSAIDYFNEGNRFKSFWPADVHIIGKDILRFHAVYWPAFLMSAGLPLPKQIFAHGWWTIEGKKMSKSLGNAIDPYSLADEYGVDPFRFFLLREVPFGLDGDFSKPAVINRINSELANDLGNLFSRTIAMVFKYFKGTVPKAEKFEELDDRVKEKALAVIKDFDENMDRLAFSRALSSVWELVSMLNKYIDESAPWILAKTPEKQGRLSTVMVCCLECLNIITLLLSPFMPSSADKMAQSIGLKDITSKALRWGSVTPGMKLKKIPALFPRIQT